MHTRKKKKTVFAPARQNTCKCECPMQVIILPLTIGKASLLLLTSMLDSDCVKVSGMQFHEEWVYWKDEDQLNLNMHGGLYPKIRRSSFPVKYTKLYYCYYTAKPGQYPASTHTIGYSLTPAVPGFFLMLPASWCWVLVLHFPPSPICLCGHQSALQVSTHITARKKKPPCVSTIGTLSNFLRTSSTLCHASAFVEARSSTVLCVNHKLSAC